MAKSSEVEQLILEPLKVTCTSSDCDSDLHCFRATKKMKVTNEVGACRACGAQLVDWDRVHERNVADVQYTLEALKFEMIRHHFWHVNIDQKALNYARRKGISAMEVAIRSRLRKSVGIANNPYDGRQTPMERSGNPIHYAQHATASCCRKCIDYWHGIPQKRALTVDEVEYFGEMAMLYILERIPDLTEMGEYVPPVRQSKHGR